MSHSSHKPYLQALALPLLLLAVGVASAAIVGRSVLAHPAGQVKGQAQAQTQPQAPVGTGFTYQGRLKSGGNPANGQFDFTFKLYDALTGGAQAGTTVTVTNQMVTEGLFTVLLDFGSSAFGGQARWLEIAVRTAGGGSYTTLTPRQALTVVPYAVNIMPGGMISGTQATPLFHAQNLGAGVGVYGASSFGQGVAGSSNSGDALSGSSVSGYGVFGHSTSSTGVRGYTYGSEQAGVYGSSSGNSYGVQGYSSTGYAAVYGQSIGTDGTGVIGVANTGAGANAVAGVSNSGTGVYGNGSTGVSGLSSISNGIGVRAQSTGSGSSSMGVYATSSNGYGVFATSGGTTSAGVYGYSAGSYGVWGQSSDLASPGVYGLNNYGIGVWGHSGTTGSNSYGVHGSASGTSNSRGVSGYSTSNIGVYGRTEAQGGAGVYGSSAGTVSYGVYGAGSGNNAISIYGQGAFGVWAGYFSGDIYIGGTCYGGCLGAAKIDHPLDPANKYLYHAAVESSDMMNIYNGNVTTDAKGEAVVAMPDWFEALNKDFRYQLTPIGQFSQAIVASKIKENRFTIKTDKPNVEVSWQVTGIRKDAYSEAHRIRVEEDKKPEERGKYLHPTEHGQPETKGIDYERQQYGKRQDQVRPPREPATPDLPRP